MSMLRTALIAGAVRQRRISLDVAVVADDADAPLPTGDRVLRGQVRLLIQAVVDSKLANPYDREFVNDVKRVPWVTSRNRASRAANRFMEIAGWAQEEHGEEAASHWEQAARLAEWLGEDYSGWPHTGETYASIADWFLGATRVGWDDQVFLRLLDDLRTQDQEVGA